jgi:DedD protein
VEPTSTEPVVEQEPEQTIAVPPPVEPPARVSEPETHVARAAPESEPAKTEEIAPKAAAAAKAASASAEASKPSAPAATAKKGDWVVQIGSFGEEENAKRQAQRVNTYGYKPEVSSVRANGRSMYRVRVGPYTTRAQADATASSLAAHGFVAQVVSAD